MIDLYTWPTPNGHKVHIMLEETGLPYRIRWVNLRKREQFDPAYLAASALVRSMPDLRYVEATVLHPDDGSYREHHAVLPHRDPVRPGTNEARMNAGALRGAQDESLKAGLDATLRPGATDRERVAALMLWQSLIHDVNALRGVLGEPARVLSAAVWNEGMAQHSLTEFKNHVRVSMSWVSLPGVKHYEERLRFVSQNLRVTLIFPSPYLRHAPTRLEVERMDGETLVVEDRVVSYDEAFRAEVHHFRESVLAGPHDHNASHRLTLAVQFSDAPPLVRPDVDMGDIPNQDGCAASIRADGDQLNILNRAQVAAPSNHVFRASHF